MKKLIAYIISFFACAYLINRAVVLIMEVWQILALGGGLGFIGWLAFRYINTKDWR
ncbi:hypothetical protein ACXZ83_00735 [Streptococcus agalactiae]|uniref:hypothetical protein n=1 Tax=Streptococcus agalactiae TaxID=1311 RepID=UPI0002F70FAA|nr:hypothetical protein [Streptococcus agalactiae]EPX04607.1 hypothetical protein SAG0163_01595 [Streptococcus agalactiae MRI Z1-215]